MVENFGKPKYARWKNIGWLAFIQKEIKEKNIDKKALADWPTTTKSAYKVLRYICSISIALWITLHIKVMYESLLPSSDCCFWQNSLSATADLSTAHLLEGCHFWNVRDCSNFLGQHYFASLLIHRLLIHHLTKQNWQVLNQ